MNQKYPVILIFTLLFTVQANAGWIITNQSYDSDQGIEAAITETIYIQDDVMKVVGQDVMTIFNLNKETITLLSPEKKIYWEGNIADYKMEIKAAMKFRMDEQLKNAPEEQSEMIRKMYQGMMESIDDPSKFAGEEPEEYDLQINKTTEKEKIAGYTAIKYEVLVNGTVKEEAWLSESNRAHNQFDIAKFHNIFGEFTSQIETGGFYKKDDSYLEFMKLGFPLKSINYFGGYESISEVISLEKESIESSEFLPPKDYKQVSLMEIGLNGEE